MTTHIDKIIERYYEGETTIDEENQLRNYLTSDQVSSDHQYMVPLFKHFKTEREQNVEFDLDLSFTNENPKKVRFMFPKLLSIAASLIILIAVAFSWFESSDTLYKDKYTQLEDPEEALAITLEALSFLGKKYDDGTKSISHIKKYEKTDVFKSNKK